MQRETSVHAVSTSSAFEQLAHSPCLGCCKYLEKPVSILSGMSTAAAPIAQTLLKVFEQLAQFCRILSLSMRMASCSLAAAVPASVFIQSVPAATCCSLVFDYSGCLLQS